MNIKTQKLHRRSFQFLFFATFIAAPLASMDNPALHTSQLPSTAAARPSLAHLARYGKIAEFKKALESLPAQALFEALPNGNTPLHEVSYPLHSVENATDATILKKDLTNEQVHRIARLHAYKADLLLRKGGNALLSQLNLKKQTPGLLAAQTGYLPVLGRIVLSGPCDLPMIAHYLSRENVKVLIEAFLIMMDIKNSPQFPKHLHPSIPADLHIHLSNNQLTSLQNKAVVEDASKILKQITVQELQYLFESYLALDIRADYLAHPEHPTVKAYFNITK
jgi:hypothetical protein